VASVASVAVVAVVAASDKHKSTNVKRHEYPLPFFDDLYSNLIMMVLGINLKPENLNPIHEMKIEQLRIIQLLYCCIGNGR
jgi:hypothetical protein